MAMPNKIDFSAPKLGGSIYTDETPDPEPEVEEYPPKVVTAQYTRDIANVDHVGSGNPSNDRSWVSEAATICFYGQEIEKFIRVMCPLSGNLGVPYLVHFHFLLWRCCLMQRQTPRLRKRRHVS